MKSIINDILLSLDKENYFAALEQCEAFVTDCLSSFMEELTINKATDFAAGVLLYAKICAMIKKPWKCVPKLDSAQGALRFMEDFILDKGILSDTFRSFAEAYERAGFFPEAAKAYYKEALYAESKERCLQALFSYFYYSEFVLEREALSFSSLKEKLSNDELENVKKEAFSEAKNKIQTDPIEKTSEYLEVRFEVESYVDDILSRETDDQTPFCVRYWNTKKMVLKEKFSIEWKTPAEMNPDIRFY